MRHAHRLLVSILALTVGCIDYFTPAETQRISGGDAAVAVTLNGCTAETFVDRTAADAERVVGLGGERGSGGFSFAPKCMTIAAGQEVTFVGAFSTHPLTPGVPGNTQGGSPANPIRLTSSGTMVAFTFPRAGVYPFVCGMHGFLGMNGVVVVR